MATYVIDNRRQVIDFENSTDMIARTIQNCKNLLMTQMGEVPYDRLRGFDPSLYHLPIDKMRMALLPELDRVMTWEPDAEVSRATADPDPDTGEIIITVWIDVNDGE